MKKAGFHNIFVGIESGNDDDLLLYNKQTTVKENEKFLKLCKKVGIEPFFGFIMINPYSSLKSLKENYNFLIKYKSCLISHYTNCLQIYSNTTIFKNACQDGLIFNDYDYKKTMTIQYNCIDVNVNSIKNFLFKFDHEYELKQKNSSFHNLIFFKNYLSAIGIKSTEVNERLNNKCENLYAILKQFFYKLYIENDLKYCKEKYNDLITSILREYSDLERIKGKLIKLYYQNV